MRIRLALAAVALAATAVPSHATELNPDCATRLVNAVAGETASCSTVGPPPVACRGCGVRRSVEIAAVTGGVDASLACGDLPALTTHVDAPNTGELGTWGSDACTLTLVATGDGTTAAATSTGSYVVGIE